LERLGIASLKGYVYWTFLPTFENLSRATITTTHAEMIASLKDPELVERDIKTIVDKNLSARQLEALVKNLLQQKEFRNIIPSLLEFHAQKAQNQWQRRGHAAGIAACSSDRMRNRPTG